MKTLYLIGGTMGVGKTTVCKELKKELKNSVFLDGDWCWDADPFQVTKETKAMVLRNICYMLLQQKLTEIIVGISRINRDKLFTIFRVRS